MKQNKTPLLIIPIVLIIILACATPLNLTLTPDNIQASAVALALTMSAQTQANQPTATEIPQTTQTADAQFETAIALKTMQVSSIQTQMSGMGNIVFNKPEHMNKDETTSVELLLSTVLSEAALATQEVVRGNFVTSTADPNVLISPSGNLSSVQTGQIEITQRMKAVLKPQDSDAFVITEMHDNAEQVVGSTNTTIWRWSVTAKKEGSQTLELIIYRLVQFGGKEYWQEVEAYRANIVVEVTPLDQLKSLDWKWIAGFIVTVVGSVLGVLTWINNNKKKAAEENPRPISRIK